MTASPENIALAELGLPTGGNSRLMVADVRAMEAAIDLSGDLDEAAVLRPGNRVLSGLGLPERDRRRPGMR